MKEMIKCTGCQACKNMCPVNAIDIIEENYYFLREVNKEKCINCGLCDKKCHIKTTNYLQPKFAYVAQSKEFKYRKKGASGGIASSIYEYAFDNGYYCVGVVYESTRFVYKILERKEDILRASGSKYVVSHLGKIHEKIIELINNDKKIIFIGLPCHVSAMKCMIDDKKNRIIWIDLVCNGVCKEEDLWTDIYKYGFDKTQIGDIRFREKNNQYGITLRDTYWDVIKKISKKEDHYMKMYEKRQNVYKHCEECIYAHNMRVGDLTLKDYVWKNGISNIIVNSEHGSNFIEKIRDYIFLKEYSVEKVISEDERMQ